jgi:predicted KAP-like P-loop ATPase
VRFNPWWFSGQEQLLLQFFGHMRTAFNRPDVPKQLKSIGSQIELFAAALSTLEYVPVAGSVVGPIRKIVAGLGNALRVTGERNEVDVAQIRKNIDKILQDQSRKVLVVIDDIDRLTASEVRLMFQVIKAVANFPKTIYLLAFARDVVVHALNQVQPGHGEAYLEKIVQVHFDLPLPRRRDLQNLFTTHLEPILQGTPDELWERTYWSNVYLDGIDPLLSNLRDVKRLLNSLQISYPMVKGEVNAVDFVAVESLRVFVPEMWNIVRDNPSIFAGSADLPGQFDPRTGANLDAKRRLLENFLQTGTTDATREATHNLLKRLFPLYASAFGGAHYGSEWARTWRTQRQVRSPEVFPLYFQFAVEEGAMTLAEFHSILAMADDVQAFAGQLERLAGELKPDGQTSRIYEFISHLEDLAHESELLPHERIPSVLQAIYDAGDSILKAKLPERMFDVPKEWRLNSLIHDLLFRLSGEERYQVLSDAFAQARSVAMVTMSMSYLGREYGKFRAGSQSPSDKTVSEEQLAALEKIALQRIEQAGSDRELDSAPNLRSILYIWEELVESDQPPKCFVNSLVQSDRGMTSFLSSCLQQIVSSGQSDRVTQSQWVIDIPTVEKWTDPYELKDTAQSLLQRQTHWLTDEDKLALETFLRNLDQAPHGYDDFNRPKDVGDTDTPS